MSEHLAGLKAHEGETDPREDKPHRVRKPNAARDDRHKDCNAKQADRVDESSIHDAVSRRARERVVLSDLVSTNWGHGKMFPKS